MITQPTDLTMLCPVCDGTRKVRICTGKWTYQCPDCLADEFETAQIDDDHFIVGPAGDTVAK
jgi:hypothetical protein